MTTTELERRFRYYNRRYWRGELPDYGISLEPLPTDADSDILAWCDRPNRTLRFDPAKFKSDREWRKTLLHEMCHILSEGHGKDFLDQIFVRCPKYVGLAECFGNRDAFLVIRYGPRRAHRAFERLGW